jgi:hypothetical protein
MSIHHRENNRSSEQRTDEEMLADAQALVKAAFTSPEADSSKGEKQLTEAFTLRDDVCQRDTPE